MMKLNDMCSVDYFDDGECVIYDSQKEDTYVLNKTAAIAFDAMISNTETNKEEALAIFKSNILNSFDIDESATADDDFLNVFTLLIEAGVLSE